MANTFKFMLTAANIDKIDNAIDMMKRENNLLTTMYNDDKLDMTNNALLARLSTMQNGMISLSTIKFALDNEPEVDHVYMDLETYQILAEWQIAYGDTLIDAYKDAVGVDITDYMDHHIVPDSSPDVDDIDIPTPTVPGEGYLN